MNHVNHADLEWTETDRGSTRMRRKRLGAAANGSRLGCSLYELPPGGASWPYHFHTGNEEALYVLSGSGSVRLAAGERTLRPGEYVSFPVGEDGAHRVVNDGDEPLRYLMVSTMSDPDVSVYPDSDKLGVFAGAPPGADGERTVEGYYRRAVEVDYWADEA